MILPAKGNKLLHTLSQTRTHVDMVKLATLNPRKRQLNAQLTTFSMYVRGVNVNKETVNPFKVKC